MDEQAKIVQNYENTKENLKTETDWINFKTDEEWTNWMKDNNIKDDKIDKELEKLKNNYLKYGSIYGKNMR